MKVPSLSIYVGVNAKNCERKYQMGMQRVLSLDNSYTERCSGALIFCIHFIKVVSYGK